MSSLASKLLEGYNNGDVAGVVVGDPSTFLQEACIEFVNESYNAFQIFKTADIIGQASVLTESADVQVVYESVVKDFGKKLKGIVSKFISKVVAWRKAVTAAAKKKIQAAKDSGLYKKVNKELEGHDDDEKIGGFSYIAIAYTVEAGMKAAESYVDAMNEVYYKAQEALFSVTSGETGEKQSDVAKKFSLDKVKSELKKSLGFDPDSVLNKVNLAFGSAEPTDTTYTVGCIKGIMASVPELESAVDNQLKEVEALEGIVKELEQKFDGIEADDGTQIDPDVLGTISASITYILNLEVSALKTSVDRILAAVDQSRNVLSAVIGTLKGGKWADPVVTPTQEGDDPLSGDDGKSDPPDDGEDPESAVTEGANINMIKKYVETCSSVIKGDMKQAEKLFKKKDYEEAKKYYESSQQKLENALGGIIDVPDTDLTVAFSGAASIIASFVTTYEDLSRNFFTDKTITTKGDAAKADDLTHGSRNVTKKKLVSKINACINRCKRQITVCESKMSSDSGVSESTSIFEQAAQYMI